MKHLKIYEQYFNTSYEWKSITKVGEKLHVDVYSLMVEFYISVSDNTNPEIVQDKEAEYIEFVAELLEDKVITFNANIDEKITGICKTVEYFSGPFMQNDLNIYEFSIETVGIYLEDDNYEYIVSGDDEVIIHMDIDADIYRNSKKYNL